MQLAAAGCCLLLLARGGGQRGGLLSAASCSPCSLLGSVPLRSARPWLLSYGASRLLLRISLRKESGHNHWRTRRFCVGAGLCPACGALRSLHSDLGVAMLVTTMRHLALLLAFDSIICVDGKAWSKKNNFADDGAEDLDSGALKDFKVAQNGGPEPDGCAEEDMVRVFKDTGNRVVFHYTTSIASFSKAGKKGQKVSSSVGGQPVWVTVGDTESPIMAGIHLALAGRCKGAQLTAVIPSHLGFGDEVRTVGNVEVPGGATLFAELEILEVHQPLPYTVISGNPLLEAGLSVTVTEGRTKVRAPTQRCMRRALH
jgi:FKBP-type peptidyl-prolyl cis-trans isomerase